MIYSFYEHVFRDKYSWNITHLKHPIRAWYLGMSDDPCMWRKFHRSLQGAAVCCSSGNWRPIIKQNCLDPIISLSLCQLRYLVLRISVPQFYLHHLLCVLFYFIKIVGKTVCSLFW